MKRSALPRIFQGSNTRAAKRSQRRNRHELLESRACLAASSIINDWIDSSLADFLSKSPSTMTNESLPADYVAMDGAAMDGAVAEQVDQIIESLPDELLEDIEDNTAPQIEDALSDDLVFDDDSMFDGDTDEAHDNVSPEGDEPETEDDATELGVSSDDGLDWRGDTPKVMGNGFGGTEDGDFATTGNAVDGSPPTFGLSPTNDKHAGLDHTSVENESSRPGLAYNHGEQNLPTSGGWSVDASALQVPGPQLANVPTLLMPATLLSTPVEAESLVLEDVSSSLAGPSPANQGGQASNELSMRSSASSSFVNRPLLARVPQTTAVAEISQASPADLPARPQRVAPTSLRPRLADVNAIVPNPPSLSGVPLPILKWEASASVALPSEPLGQSESLKQNHQKLQSLPPEATTIPETTEPATDLSTTRLEAFWGVAVASLITVPQLRRPSRSIWRLIRDNSLRYRPMPIEPLEYQSKQGNTDTSQPIDRT